MKILPHNSIKQELSTAKTDEQDLHDERNVEDRHRWHMGAKIDVFVDADHSKLPTTGYMYLHFIQYPISHVFFCYF